MLFYYLGLTWIWVYLNKLHSNLFGLTMFCIKLIAHFVRALGQRLISTSFTQSLFSSKEVLLRMYPNKSSSQQAHPNRRLSPLLARFLCTHPLLGSEKITFFLGSIWMNSVFSQKLSSSSFTHELFKAGKKSFKAVRCCAVFNKGHLVKLKQRVTLAFEIMSVFDKRF